VVDRVEGLSTPPAHQTQQCVCRGGLEGAGHFGWPGDCPIARLRANDLGEKSHAQQAMACAQIRVVLQVAQPVKPSRLFPQVLDPMDAQIGLKRAVRAVDSHPMCIYGNATQQMMPRVRNPAQPT